MNAIKLPTKDQKHIKKNTLKKLPHSIENYNNK